MAESVEDLVRRIAETKKSLGLIEKQLQEKQACIDPIIWNDPEACYSYAKKIRFITDREKNLHLAEKCYRRCIELGKIEAYHALGNIYLDEYEDIDEAIEIFGKGLSAGDYESSYYLGEAFLSPDKADIDSCIKAWDLFAKYVIMLIGEHGQDRALSDEFGVQTLYRKMITYVVAASIYFKERAIHIITANHNHMVLIGLCGMPLLDKVLKLYGLSGQDDIQGMMALGNHRFQQFRTTMHMMQECVKYIQDKSNQFFI